MEVWIKKPCKSSPYYQIEFSGLLGFHIFYKSSLIKKWDADELSDSVNICLNKKEFENLIKLLQKPKIKSKSGFYDLTDKIKVIR